MTHSRDKHSRISSPFPTPFSQQTRRAYRRSRNGINKHWRRETAVCPQLKHWSFSQASLTAPDFMSRYLMFHHNLNPVQLVFQTQLAGTKNNAHHSATSVLAVLHWVALSICVTVVKVCPVLNLVLTFTDKPALWLCSVSTRKNAGTLFTYDHITLCQRNTISTTRKN